MRIKFEKSNDLYTIHTWYLFENIIWYMYVTYDSHMIQYKFNSHTKGKRWKNQTFILVQISFVHHCLECISKIVRGRNISSCRGWQDHSKCNIIFLKKYWFFEGFFFPVQTGSIIIWSLQLYIHLVNKMLINIKKSFKLKKKRSFLFINHIIKIYT